MADHLFAGQAADVVEQCVAELGLDLDGVELRGSGPKRVLRVIVDRDGGVPLDLITETSRELSRELDRSDVMGSVGYTLEVTSRGMDRPLTLLRHWERNRDRLVVLTLTDGEKLRGRIAEVTTSEVTLEGGRKVAFEAVTSAFIEPEVNRRGGSADRSGERKS